MPLLNMRSGYSNPSICWLGFAPKRLFEIGVDRLVQPDVSSSDLGKIPAMFEHLMEDFCLVDLALKADRNGLSFTLPYISVYQQ